MNLFFLISLVVFSCLRAIAIAAHYLGDSPHGGKLVVSPFRLMINSILIEVSVIILITVIFAFVSNLISKLSKRKKNNGSSFILLLNYSYLAFMAIYMIFAQLDLESSRWMGEHISLSFFSNYIAGGTDSLMLGKLLKSDIFFSSIALIFILLSVLITVFLKRWIRENSTSRKTTIIVLIVLIIFGSSPIWLMPSSKRWSRIRPAAIGITYEFFREISGMEEPKNPKQAFADLISYKQTGKLADKPLDSIPEYPLLTLDGRNQNRKNLYNIEQFKNLPDSLKPNVIYITYETWRGWKSSLSGDTTTATFNPELDSIIKKDAYYFPYAHTHGYPSVEGTLGIHLGLWSHFRKIFINDYLSVNSISLPEIFRNLGYHTEIYVGADPSFSNLGPWFKKWYNYFEYSKKYASDGPLLERFTAAIDRVDKSKPFFFSTWTVTCHPPYKIPKSEGIEIAKTNDERYSQAMAYTDKHIAKFIKHIKKTGVWDNSIVMIVGDHSQPNSAARNNPKLGGTYTQGHTWVPVVIMGGWKGVPDPKRNEMTISQLDAAPSLLDLINVNAPNHFFGRSLIPPGSYNSKNSLGETNLTQPEFKIEPRQIISFYRNHVAHITDHDRIQFNIFDNSFTHYEIDKNSVINYALLEGHTMKISEQAPYEFNIERYRDMIFAYGKILDENRLIPSNIYPKKPLGIYKYIE